MSDFIDERFLIHDYGQNSPHLQSRKNSQNSRVKQNYQQEEVLKNLARTLPQLSQNYWLEKRLGSLQHLFKITLILNHDEMKFVSFRMSLVINFMTKCISISLTIFQHQKPFRIKSLDQRILFSKLYSKSFIKHENKISVSIWNGDFKILRPECYFWESDFLQILQGKSKQKSLHNIVQRCLNDMTIVCKPLLKHIYHYKEETKLYPNNSKLIQKSIYRYIIKSSIQPAFDISYGSGKYETMQWLTKEENYYTNSMVTTIVTDLSQFHSHLLYITPKVPLNQLPALYVKDYFYTSDEEVNSLKLKALPPANRANFSLEAKYVYNIIEINEVIPMNFKKVSVGGFSEISIAQIQFWYLMTVSGKRMAKVDELKKDNHSIPEQRSKKINKKILVFKSNSYKGAESGRNRVHHEMKIVSKFKGTPSIFFSQYFKTVNTKALFSQYLIMEYLPYPTLNQYTELNKFTSSFLTKVHLASMIVHSLHLLKNHGIVHMDLKPSNIIVSKRMIPKILDFGQSFCKDVCDKNFRPAFSMPYGCPEIFDGIGRADFNQKNDVYSLGIILFELLFKRTPFVFTQQKASRIFKQREYFKYIYFVPEEEDKYGQFQIISLVRNVIFRCLDVNIKNRPYTIWLTIILKEFWTHLINLQLNPLVS